jgi:hypothetical protein
LTVNHRKQDHHPFKFVTAKAAACQCHSICLLEDVPAFGVTWLSNRRVFRSFFGRRIELCDLAKAIGLGIVRSGDKRSAHFRAVPAGYDAKPKGLFCLNVTRRKVLHGAHAFGLAFDLLSSAGAWSCRDAFCKEGLSDSFVRSFDPNSYRFLDELVASSRIALSRLVFGRSRSHLRSEQEYFLATDNCRAIPLKLAAIHLNVGQPSLGCRSNADR